MWGAVSVHSLYPRDAPVFFDDLLKHPDYKVPICLISGTLDGPISACERSCGKVMC